MTKIVRYLDSSHQVFQEGYLSRSERYRDTILVGEGALKIEIDKSILSEHERTHSILQNVTCEKNDIEWMKKNWGPRAWFELDPHDLVKKTTATFDIDFSQDPSTTEDTKRVYAKIINARYPMPSSPEGIAKS